MANSPCSDTGPILHLYEINQSALINIFKKLLITYYIKEELLKYSIKNLPKNVKLIHDLNKDQIVLLSERYDLDIGESSVIWLCKSLKVPLFLTDDLTAREVAGFLGIRAIGAIGIIIRCFREGVINQKETIAILKNIKNNSSLFITSELINFAISEIKKFAS